MQQAPVAASAGDAHHEQPPRGLLPRPADHQGGLPASLWRTEGLSYDPMFSVEEVNRLAANGMPFRDAYKKVGLDIEAGTFKASHDIHHTHEGSIGNLCNDQIQALMQQTLDGFHFDRMTAAESKLLGR